MRIQTAAALILAFVTASAFGQRQVASYPSQTPKLDLSFGFEAVRANAPPGISSDFGLFGGRTDAAYHFTRQIAAVAEFSGSHANLISNTGQNLTLTTYTFGPRITFNKRRVKPFGEALFGAGHGSNSYFPTGTTYTTSASSFAYSFGGGVDVNLTHRFAIRALEAQYLHTALPNGTTNHQNQLVIGAGVLLKFGNLRKPMPGPVAELVTPPAGDIHFSCSLNVTHVAAGSSFRVLGDTMTEPDHLNVIYTWMPEVGMIEGSGREVKLWTSGLAPGNYVLKGHAAVMGDYNLAADCELPFAVDRPAVAAAELPPPPPPPPAATVKAKDKEFHANVPDAYFEYNSALLRPDAYNATLHAADFLNQHQDMQVQVEGFADERGSVEYNLMLGQQRAEAARGALIKAGVAASRVAIISYGKADPVCTATNEICYQQNRRAAFSLHP